MRIRLDKIASSTRNADLHHEVVVSGPVPPESGVVVAARVLDDKSTYNTVEDVHGRMMRVHKGDVVAGVLGAREALRGYAGRVPEAVEVGDVLHLLNLGGVIGECTSVNPDIGPPCRVEVLGAVQHFPQLGRRVGVPARIAPGPIALADSLPADLPPIVLIAGTCMHAGKTAAACHLVRAATARGMRVAATKVTGVALRRDSLEMRDHGAVAAVTFVDAGIVSTAGQPTQRIAKGCIGHLVRTLAPDLVVVELGDGILGSYGVAEILDDPVLRGLQGSLVLAATDPVAAWGGVELLDQSGWRPAVVTGPATDNASGTDKIEQMCGVAAINARGEEERFAGVVLDALDTPITAGGAAPDVAAGAAS